MDLDLTPTKSADETELDTPPHTHAQSIKKHHPPPPPPPLAAVAYKECMKNHAANIGGHAVDGCGEYMLPPTAVPTDPTSLICAACGCHRNFHRNFHRREPESPTAAITPPFLDFRRPGQVPPPNRTSSPSPPFRYAPHMLVPLSAAVAAEEQHHHQEPVTPTAENPLGRKRFRTRFSHEQKEKMLSFSEKLGWKMQKSDEAAVEEFCREAGVAKGVLKVWMHNNKNTAGKKELTAGGGGGGLMMSLKKSINGGGGNGGNEEMIRKSDDDDDDDDNGGRFQNESGGRVHFLDSNYGSSSSA